MTQTAGQVPNTLDAHETRRTAGDEEQGGVTYRLSPDDLDAISALLDEVTPVAATLEPDALLELAVTWSHELPREVRRFLTHARLHDTPFFAITGYQIDDAAIGPTPDHWVRADPASTLREEVLLFLYASLLGDPYSVSLLQAGRLLNDVMPIRGREASVTAASSEQRLVWHTEEAGFDFRPDYQGFVCLRNPSRVPTTVACTDWLELSERSLAVLGEPSFDVAPWRDASDRRLRLPLLFGGSGEPYIRLDPVYTTPTEGDPEAEAALRELTDAVERALRPLRHDAGDFFFIDNWRAVHGREAYEARFDGTDRWMKRVKIARSLRVSRPLRDTANARVVAAERLL